MVEFGLDSGFKCGLPLVELLDLGFKAVEPLIILLWPAEGRGVDVSPRGSDLLGAGWLTSARFALPGTFGSSVVLGEWLQQDLMGASAGIDCEPGD